MADASQVRCVAGGLTHPPAPSLNKRRGEEEKKLILFPPLFLRLVLSKVEVEGVSS